MKRKGILAINEDELLQIIDLALTSQHPKTWTPHYDKLVSSHLLTGIEFMGLKEQRDHGFEGDNHVLADPRASLFAAAFARSMNAADGAGAAAGHGLPEEVAKALRDGSSASVLDAVRTIVAKKISDLILLPVKKLKPKQDLGDFGLDSMLAAEFRTFTFKALEVDVPFMTLLAKSTSVNSLTQLIADAKGGEGNSGVTSPWNAYLDYRLRGFFNCFIVLDTEKEEQSCGSNWNCQSPGPFGFQSQ